MIRVAFLISERSYKCNSGVCGKPIIFCPLDLQSVSVLFFSFTGKKIVPECDVKS